MSCINYYLLKRILDITCGNVLITLLRLSQIIGPNMIMHRMTEWIRTVCVGVCLPTGACMYILTYCIVYTLFASLFTKQLISIFVLVFMLLSLSAFVRFLLKKLLACLKKLYIVLSAYTHCFVKVEKKTRATDIHSY